MVIDHTMYTKYTCMHCSTVYKLHHLFLLKNLIILEHKSITN